MNTVKSTDNLINAYAGKTHNAPAKKPDGPADNEKTAGKPNPGVNVSVKKSADSTESGVYSKKTANKTDKNGRPSEITTQINLLRQQTAEQLVQMIYDILSMQGKHGYIARRNLENAILGLKDYLENGGTVTPEEQAAAAAAIAEDGPWGVEAVSDRLVNMAVKFADGDESKYNMMKSAIEAGFKMAEAMWGGRLPDISYKTFDATMTKLAAAFGKTDPAEAG